MELNTKLVEFNDYCSDCKHWKKSHDDDPCNECLSCGAREGTRVPLYFEESKDSKKRKKGNK